MAELKINKQEKILILTPHPDDESIGCGGFLLKYAAQCDVILLTDGAKGGGGWNDQKTRLVRKNEFQKAMKHLGVHKYKLFGIPDLKLAENIDCLQKIHYENYAYILVPNLFESHKDHCVIFSKIDRIIRQRQLKICVLQYEVWTPLPKPTHYLDISDIIGDKERLIQFYKCPLRNIDYDRRSTALAYYRGILFGCAYAECYRMTCYPLGLEQRLKRLLEIIRNIGKYRTWLKVENS